MNTDQITLVHAYLDGEMNAAEQAALRDWLATDESNVDRFVAECRIHSELWDKYQNVEKPLDEMVIPDAPYSIPPLSPLPSPLSPSFVGGPVFSYMVATVVLCLMMLGAWAYKINHDRNIAFENSRSTTPSGPHELVFVGRITGMNDCRWSETGEPSFVGAAVLLNREYSVASGLVEITYKSGARVILEGPCTYKVDSDAGGYLERGKLTARIDGAKPQAANPDPRNSSFIPHPSSFVVTTPTAIVIDLGTEFGVEVDENGDTVSYVFQGLVKVQGLAASADSSDTEKVLHKNESIRVSRVRETHQEQSGNKMVRFTHPIETPKFVRQLHRQRKVIDLLDIVAGGNGLGRQRERGINPADGMEDTMFFIGYRFSDKHYHPVEWNDLIDGVFKPDGRDGAVEVDSAGHTYEAFPVTDGRMFGSIWSRAADVGKVRAKINRSWTYSMVNDAQFMPQRRGLMVFYANAGITFDLDAIRKTHPDMSPARFRAIAGLADGAHSNPEDFGQVDLWILVDGRVKYKREKLRVRDGVVDLDVRLSPANRFLTLAVTDGGNGFSLDCAVFGEPVLEAAPTGN